MASSLIQPRRVRKLPSSSVLDTASNNFRADPDPASSTTTTITTPTQASTNARLAANAPQIHSNPASRVPTRHLRGRSQSQANIKDDYSNGHQHSSSTSTIRNTRRVVSTAHISQRQAATTIESLISKPPASLTEALQDLRYLILTQGIAADSDGNVSSPSPFRETLAANI